MKKYIATAVLCLATVLPTFAQTRRVMTVHQKDGTTKVYKVNSIENVTFTDEALATLSNQWAYNDDVKDLSKVTMLDANGSYVFALYGSDSDTKPVFELTIPQSLMGHEITLGSDDAQDVKVAYNGETPKLTGTLQASLRRTSPSHSRQRLPTTATCAAIGQTARSPRFILPPTASRPPM